MKQQKGLLEAAQYLSWGVLAAGVFAVSADAFSAMSEEEKAEIKEQLGNQFSACMKVVTHWAYCYMKQLGVGIYDANYNCDGDTSPVGLLAQHGFQQDLREACAQVMQIQPADSGCMQDSSGVAFCPRQ
jgi:hypothetical protein